MRPGLGLPATEVALRRLLLRFFQQRIDRLGSGEPSDCLSRQWPMSGMIFCWRQVYLGREAWQNCRLDRIAQTTCTRLAKLKVARIGRWQISDDEGEWASEPA